TGGMREPGTGGSPGEDRECPDGCFIDGTCIQANQDHPDEPCQLCLPERSANAWSLDEACCTDGDHPVSLACADDQVVQVNACGDVVSVVEDCSVLANHTCREAA